MTRRPKGLLLSLALRCVYAYSTSFRFCSHYDTQVQRALYAWKKGKERKPKAFSADNWKGFAKSIANIDSEVWAAIITQALTIQDGSLEESEEEQTSGSSDSNNEEGPGV